MREYENIALQSKTDITETIFASFFLGCSSMLPYICKLQVKKKVLKWVIYAILLRQILQEMHK